MDDKKQLPLPGVNIIQEHYFGERTIRGKGWWAEPARPLWARDFTLFDVHLDYHPALYIKIAPKFFPSSRDIEQYLDWLATLLNNGEVRSVPALADACCAMQYNLSPIHTAGRTHRDMFFADVGSRSTHQSFDLFRVGINQDNFVVRIYDKGIGMLGHQMSLPHFRDMYTRMLSTHFSPVPWGGPIRPNYDPQALQYIHMALAVQDLEFDAEAVKAQLAEKEKEQEKKAMQVRDKIKEAFGLTKPEGSYDHLHRECSITSLATEIGLNAKGHCSHRWTAFGLAAVAFGASPLDFGRGFVKDRDDVKGTFTAQRYRSKVLKAVPNIITREFLSHMLMSDEIEMDEKQMAEAVEALFMVCHQKAGPVKFTLDMRSILESFLDDNDESSIYEDFINAHTEVRDPGEEAVHCALIEVDGLCWGRAMVQAGILVRALKTGEVRMPNSWAEVREDVLMAAAVHEETSFVDGMPRCVGRGADAEMCIFCDVSDLCQVTRDYGMLAGLAEMTADYDWCKVPSRQCAMVCGECPYAETVGGGRWKPPITDLLRCSVREDWRETSPKRPETLCDRGHTNRCYITEKAGDRYVGLNVETIHGDALKLFAGMRGVDVAAYEGAADEELRAAIIEKDRAVIEKIATFGRRFGVSASRLREVLRLPIGYGREKKA